MDVFLMIRRQKSNIFLDAKETNSVAELKEMLQGLARKSKDDIRLFKDDLPLEDHKTLADSGFTCASARAQNPASIGMSFRGDDGEFEALVIEALSNPPDLPDAMKTLPNSQQGQGMDAELNLITST